MRQITYLLLQDHSGEQIHFSLNKQVLHSSIFSLSVLQFYVMYFEFKLAPSGISILLLKLWRELTG